MRDKLRFLSFELRGVGNSPQDLHLNHLNIFEYICYLPKYARLKLHKPENIRLNIKCNRMPFRCHVWQHTSHPPMSWLRNMGSVLPGNITIYHWYTSSSLLIILPFCSIANCRYVIKFMPYSILAGSPGGGKWDNILARLQLCCSFFSNWILSCESKWGQGGPREYHHANHAWTSLEILPSCQRSANDHNVLIPPWAKSQVDFVMAFTVVAICQEATGKIWTSGWISGWVEANKHE